MGVSERIKRAFLRVFGRIKRAFLMHYFPKEGVAQIFTRLKEKVKCFIHPAKFFQTSAYNASKKESKNNNKSPIGKKCNIANSLIMLQKTAKTWRRAAFLREWCCTLKSKILYREFEWVLQFSFIRKKFVARVPGISEFQDLIKKN